LYRNNSSAAYSNRQLADYCTGTIHLRQLADYCIGTIHLLLKATATGRLLYLNNSSAAYSNCQLADYCTGTIHLLLITTANWQIIVPEQFICCL
jgi:hypothetical protein